jgi:hypothetical protein
MEARAASIVSAWMSKYPGTIFGFLGYGAVLKIGGVCDTVPYRRDYCISSDGKPEFFR